MNIIKRNGAEETFNIEKIVNAVVKANKATEKNKLPRRFSIEIKLIYSLIYNKPHQLTHTIFLQTSPYNTESKKRYTQTN